MSKDTVKPEKIEALYERSAKILSEKNTIPEELYSENKVKRGLRNSNGEIAGYEKDEDGNKIPIEGKLYYRGYNVEDIVMNAYREKRFGFEETAFLLMLGSLPTKADLETFNGILGSHRELPNSFARDMILTAPSNNIMNKLARCVLALYSYDDNPDDISIKNVIRQSMNLMGYFPAIICYAFQAKNTYYGNQSLHLHAPIPGLSTSENILRMLRPLGEYTDLEAKLLDICMILHAEHGGGNNSSFTTHLVSSTGTDTYSEVDAAVGSLKGPKHGGANIAVIEMIEDIKAHVKDLGNTGKLDDYLVKILKGKANDRTGLVYGMGHAIYTKSDPRAKILKDMAKQLAESKDKTEDFYLCDYIERHVPELYAEVHGREVLMPANVDLYSGFVYSALDIPVDVATPLFATARLAGWSAHRLEELVNGGKLMRPAYNTVQDHMEYVPMKDRKSEYKMK